MDSRKGEEPREALRGREANEALRRPAVLPVLDKGMRPAEVAGLVDRGKDWVKTRVAQYAEGGFGALRDLPRAGRPARHGAATCRRGRQTGRPGRPRGRCPQARLCKNAA